MKFRSNREDRDETASEVGRNLGEHHVTKD